MTTAKFRIGDRVRLSRGYALARWLRVGRVYTIIGLRPAVHGRHCEYLLRSGNGRQNVWSRSDRLRDYPDRVRGSRGSHGLTGKERIGRAA